MEKPKGKFIAFLQQSGKPYFDYAQVYFTEREKTTCHVSKLLCFYFLEEEDVILENARAMVHPTFQQRRDSNRFPNEVLSHHTLEYHAVTESHLRYYHPKFFEVPLESLGTLCYVLEVVPGIRRKTRDLEEFEVLLMGDREVDWPSAFLDRAFED